MGRRHRWTWLIIEVALVTAFIVVDAGRARAGFQWTAPYVSTVAGYDTNVRRAPADSPSPDRTVEGDGRVVVLASLGGRYEGDRLSATVEARPYFVKYFNLKEFDRADGFAAGELFYALTDRWSLELIDRFRYTYFTNRNLDRLYNTLEPALVWTVSDRWRLASQYRYMYRNNPRRVIEWWQANGVGGWAAFEATDRLSLKLFGRVDFQTVQFVFPRDNNGRRYWADLSGRYLLGSRTLLMGKYLFQEDTMEFSFAPGLDPDQLGDPADDLADGILQSLRFTEDSSNNYRKHLILLLSHTSVGKSAFVEAFFLYQNKRFDQGVIQLPDRPQRLDHTFVAQAYCVAPLGSGWSFLGTLRYEQNQSNDPRADYDYVIAGAGLKWSF